MWFRLTARDAAAVRDWMETGRPFHCVRDHPSHASSPVFGGLWGGKLPHLRELISTPIPIADRMKVREKICLRTKKLRSMREIGSAAVILRLCWFVRFYISFLIFVGLQRGLHGGYLVHDERDLAARQPLCLLPRQRLVSEVGQRLSVSCAEARRRLHR